MLSLKSGLVYKAVRPKRVLFGVKVVLTVLVFTAAAVMLIAAFIAFIQNRESVFLVLAGAVLFVILAITLIKPLKTDKKVLERRQRILDSLDEHLLERLEEEVRTAEKYFKCFYVLDEFLFVPKAGLLLRYDEIKKFKTIYHSTNSIPDGVFIEIFDSENIKYCFSVKKWRDYRKSYNEFMALLSRKGLGGAGGSGGQNAPGNGGYIPVGRV